MLIVSIVGIIMPFLYSLGLKILMLGRKMQNKLLLILFSVQTIIITGTRTVQTGADTGNYFRFYEVALKEGLNERTVNYFEPLFSVIGIICAKTGLNFAWFNIIIAALTMYFFSKSILKMKCNAFIAAYLYMCFALFYNMMNQVRQALAMMIVLYAVTFLKDNQKAKFVKWILVASTVHLSSMIALVLMFIWNIKINRRILAGYFFAAVCLATTSNIVFRVIEKTFSYGHYLTESWRYGAYDKNAILNLVVRITILIFALIFHSELVRKDKNIDGYYHMILICTVLQVLVIKNNAIGRITTIFYYAYLFIIPKIIDNVKLFRKARIIMYPVFLLCMFLYYYVYLTSKASGELYQSVLFNT